MITGMPALCARARADFIASGLASVTMMPSTFLSMAAFTSWACCCASASWEYRKLMLSLTAACSAPLWTMSQKVSPSPEWVIIAKVQRGCPPPPCPRPTRPCGRPRRVCRRYCCSRPGTPTVPLPARCPPMSETVPRGRALLAVPCCACGARPAPAGFWKPQTPHCPTHKRSACLRGSADGHIVRTLRRTRTVGPPVGAAGERPPDAVAGRGRPTRSPDAGLRAALAAGTRRSSGTAGRCGCRTRPRVPCRRRWCAPW